MSILKKLQSVFSTSRIIELWKRFRVFEIFLNKNQIGFEILFYASNVRSAQNWDFSHVF